MLYTLQTEAQEFRLKTQAEETRRNAVNINDPENAASCT